MGSCQHPTSLPLESDVAQEYSVAALAEPSSCLRNLQECFADFEQRCPVEKTQEVSDSERSAVDIVGRMGLQGASGRREREVGILCRSLGRGLYLFDACS